METRHVRCVIIILLSMRAMQRSTKPAVVPVPRNPFRLFDIHSRELLLLLLLLLRERAETRVFERDADIDLARRLRQRLHLNSFNRLRDVLLLIEVSKHLFCFRFRACCIFCVRLMCLQSFLLKLLNGKFSIELIM